MTKMSATNSSSSRGGRMAPLWIAYQRIVIAFSLLILLSAAITVVVANTSWAHTCAPVSLTVQYAKCVVERADALKHATETISDLSREIKKILKNGRIRAVPP